VPAMISHATTTPGRTPIRWEQSRPASKRGQKQRLLAAVTPTLAAASLAGCSVTIGGSDTVDEAKMADRVSKMLRDASPDPGVRSVVCPKGVKVAEGATFQCTAEVASGQLPVTVTLSHVTKAGEYHYDLQPAKAIIDADKAVAAIRSSLPAQAANAAVDCGTPRVRVVEVGGKIACTVSQGSTRQVVQVVVDNVAGKVHFEPAATASPTPATGKTTGNP
jgi:Domain of unknown function (DUF4333)